ncbi:beta-amyrin 6-beta-monooxygenase-like [Impatiens glandulifera]|uniref:beta-amyrin 6-beta-monooxygenase-like n=1 Tax=Impatiens glandulifera TaxID=253017 RepID=UPI001FB0B412|nr:beta-amyrin 6-beta-monooxygenase-like [Impatiens glandulifera]
MTREEEEFVVSNMIGLLLASYDTTSSVLTFSLNFIAELPHIFQKVYEEQMDIVSSKSGGEYSLDWEDIQKMKYTWNVVRESMRIVPPTQGNFNDVITDMDYAGFTIPKGWKTFWSTFSTHNNPEYFPEPEKFDPSRFEGQGPAPFTFVPFGGGAHMCSGREYARLEIMVFIHRVVTQFKLEKVVKDEKIVYIGSPIPANGLPLRLHRH